MNYNYDYRSMQDSVLGSTKVFTIGRDLNAISQRLYLSQRWRATFSLKKSSADAASQAQSAIVKKNKGHPAKPALDAMKLSAVKGNINWKMVLFVNK